MITLRISRGIHFCSDAVSFIYYEISHIRGVKGIVPHETWNDDPLEYVLRFLVLIAAAE